MEVAEDATRRCSKRRRRAACLGSIFNIVVGEAPWRALTLLLRVAREPAAKSPPPCARHERACGIGAVAASIDAPGGSGMRRDHSRSHAPLGRNNRMSSSGQSSAFVPSVDFRHFSF